MATAVRELLLATLEEVGEDELETFQWYLLICFSITEHFWKRWLNSVTRDVITDTYFSFLAERSAFGKADLISDSAGKCAALKLRSCVSNRRSFTQKAFKCAYRCGTSCCLPCRFLFSVFRRRVRSTKNARSASHRGSLSP
uniref:Uncharacterized protein n=1 Tax=Esox lucius TaxID=8010 RepID=A0A6Q2X567_ESOLU